MYLQDRRESFDKERPTRGTLEVERTGWRSGSANRRRSQR